MSRFKLLLFFLCLFIASISSNVMAGSLEKEREYLSLLVAELVVIEQLIKKAEAVKDATARTTFQYDWLRADIHKIRDGIKSHLNEPRTKPRQIKPLKGQYQK